MQYRNQQQGKHLLEITQLLSMYHALNLSQLGRLYPKLEQSKLLLILKKLEKAGRLVFGTDRESILYTKDCVPDPSITAAFWVLLDFRKDITYHTASDFPVALTLYTQLDVYDVIHIPEGKEMLMNHALSAH